MPQRVAAQQLIASGEYGPRSTDVLYQTVVKLLAFVGMLATLPLMLAAALAVRLSSRGPVLNQQYVTLMPQGKAIPGIRRQDSGEKILEQRRFSGTIVSN